MSIPKFDFYGVLPFGIYEAKIDEIRECFCNYGNKKLRENLFITFEKYFDEIKKHNTEYEIYIDGSFVTNKEEPGDIDILLFFNVEYNNKEWLTLINDDYIKAKYKGVQVLAAFLDSDSKTITLDFAHDCEHIPGIRKGLVRVIL